LGLHHRIGVISDTHGLLRPEAADALRGCELVIHAGDIGTPDVIDALRGVAPVVAVRGNNDRGAWARRIPRSLRIPIGETSIYVLHDVKELVFDPRKKGIRVVVSGHSHRPVAENRDGVLYLNPGSAGPRRFNLPVSVARLEISGGEVRARLLRIDTPADRDRRASRRAGLRSETVRPKPTGST
jgi:hypothetical protein